MEPLVSRVTHTPALPDWPAWKESFLHLPHCTQGWIRHSIALYVAYLAVSERFAAPRAVAARPSNSRALLRRL
jgi:hypothetical protein